MASDASSRAPSSVECDTPAMIGTRLRLTENCTSRARSLGLMCRNSPVDPRTTVPCTPLRARKSTRSSMPAISASCPSRRCGVTAAAKTPLNWGRGGMSVGMSVGLVCQRREHHFTDLDVAMVALQDDGARLAFIGALRNGGQTVDVFVIDDFVVVEDDGDVAADEPDVVALPLADLLAGVHGGQDAAVECAIAVGIGGLTEIVKDLDFVAAAQADAAVGVLAQFAFDVNFEVPELLVGDQVVGARCIGERAVFDRPPEGLAWDHGVPAREILAVEEGDGLAFLPGAVVVFVDLGCAHSGELEGGGAVVHLALDLVAAHLDGVLEVLLLLTLSTVRREVEDAVLDGDLRDRIGIAAGEADETAFDI